MLYKAAFAAERAGIPEAAAGEYQTLAADERLDPMIRGRSALRLGLLRLAGRRIDDAAAAFRLAGAAGDGVTAEVAARALAALGGRLAVAR
jgi:hypothetical protein